MVIVADSSLQLALETIEALNIQVVEYPLFVNGEPYPVSMSMTGEEKEKLRQLIKDKKNNVSTSGLKEADLRLVFERFKDQKILTIHQSARMSTITVSVLQKVKSELSGLDIELFDTHHMLAAYTVQVLLAARALRAGMAYPELVEMMKRNRMNTRHVGSVYDLFFLQRTGRIGRAKAILGTAMKIIPLLGSSEEAGVLRNIGKAKTYQQANQKFIATMAEDMESKKARRVTAVISQIGPYDRETGHLKQLIEQQGWDAEVQILATNHSAMPHAGPDFYDLGYTVHED
jgi:DegV family protein with EDD domain